MSLNQLTANYTDSEKEDNDSGDDMDGVISSDDEHQSENKESTKGTPANFEELKGSATNTPKRKIGRLVSYGPNEEDEDEDMFKDDEFEEGIYTDPLNANVEMRDDKLPLERNLGIKLPPAPPGKCSVQLQEKITHMLERGKNMDWNRKIQNNKEFRNPSIYEKLIDHLGLDEMGSNFPLEMFDPHCWGKESFCDELSKIQKEEMDRREKERKEKTKVDILTGTKKPLEEEAKKRKSRFDQAIPGNTAGMLKPAVPPPTLTTVPSGNKPTISAFGSLKKPK